MIRPTGANGRIRCPWTATATAIARQRGAAQAGKAATTWHPECLLVRHGLRGHPRAASRRVAREPGTGAPSEADVDVACTARTGDATTSAARSSTVAASGAPRRRQPGTRSQTRRDTPLGVDPLERGPAWRCARWGAGTDVAAARAVHRSRRDDRAVELVAGHTAAATSSSPTPAP